MHISLERPEARNNKKRYLSDKNNSELTKIGRFCSTCHKDISSECYIKCIICKGYNQCLECFSLGYESKCHLRSHKYILLEPELKPLYREDWTLEEEILLLNCLRKHGFGNWQDISNSLKTKSPIECKTHYLDCYINRKDSPHSSGEILKPCIIPPDPDFCTLPQESCPKITVEQTSGVSTPAVYAGWMPLRMEFESDYMTDAEKHYVVELEFDPKTDTHESFNDKLRRLRSYNEQLNERHKRTLFAVEYDLLDGEFKGFGPQTRDNKILEEQLLPLAQILTKEELTDFVLSLETENKIKSRIYQLYNWHKNGITKKTEGIMFEQLEDLCRREEKILPSQIEKWNKDFEQFSNFSDKQILSASETILCENLGVDSDAFLKTKDILIREFTVRGEMNEELAVSFASHNPTLMRAVYKYMSSVGLFVVSLEEVDSIKVEHDESLFGSALTEANSMAHDFNKQVSINEVAMENSDNDNSSSNSDYRNFRNETESSDVQIDD